MVVGAGAAGNMAAIFAAEQGCDVFLIERTADGGRKILISGGGHCNILPSILDSARYVTASSPNTLKKIIHSWPLAKQRAFFEKTLGLPLILQPETGKFFPASNKAGDVRDSLVNYALKKHVKIWFESLVQDIKPVPKSRKWEVFIDGGKMIVADSVVIATGGLSAAATGSDGIGLRIARTLGHKIRDTYPALTPLVTNPTVHTDLSGISIDVTIRGTREGRRYTSKGAFLFTHRGYSGPAILDISHLASRAGQNNDDPKLVVQWTKFDDAGWDDIFKQNLNVLVATLLRENMPARLAAVLMNEAGVPADRRLSELHRAERLKLTEFLVRYPLPWTGFESYRKAEVTGGGVDLGEVFPKTLESRKHPGLFFCGEMLDACGPIGGYNFAWAWVTGRAAGIGASIA